MIVGFTGTRQPRTPAQSAALRRELADLCTFDEALAPDHADLTRRMLSLLAADKPYLAASPGWREWVADAREAMEAEET